MLHEPSSVNVPPWQPQRTSYHEHRACMLSQVAHALLKACPVVAGAASMRRTKGMGRGGEVQCASRWTLGVVAIVQEAPRGIVVVVQEASGLVELSGGNAGGVWGKRGVHVDVSNLLSDRHARPPHPHKRLIHLTLATSVVGCRRKVAPVVAAAAEVREAGAKVLVQLLILKELRVAPEAGGSKARQPWQQKQQQREKIKFLMLSFLLQ
eukprot:365992-Chlamydomonas_euryale.AAC.8